MYTYPRNKGVSSRAGKFFFCMVCVYLGIRYTYPRKEGVSSREGTCRVCVYLGIYMHVGMYTYPPNEGLSSRAVTRGVYKKENIHDKKIKI